MRLAGPWRVLNPAEGEYELSLWARADQHGAQVEIKICNAVDHYMLRSSKVKNWSLSEKFTLSNNWQRYSIHGHLNHRTVTATGRLFIYLRIIKKYILMPSA